MASSHRSDYHSAAGSPKAKEFGPQPASPFAKFFGVQSASQESPVGAVLEGSLSRKKKSSVRDYLVKITRGTEQDLEGPGLSYILNKFDKYNLVNRPGAFFEARDSSAARRLGTFLSKSHGMGIVYPRKVGLGDAPLDPVFDAPKDLGDLFEKISKKFDLSFAVDKSGRELYMKAGDITQIAMPVQNLKGRALEAGIVDIGSSRRGAYKVGFLGTDKEYTYSQIYYHKLRKLADSTADRAVFLRAVQKLPDAELGLGVKGKIKLRTLLAGSVTMRGTDDALFTTKTMAMKKRMLLGDNELSREVKRRYLRAQEAGQIISTVTKSKSGSQLGAASNLVSPGMSSSEMLAVALRERESFENFIGDLTGGSHPLIKPEHLLGEKGLILPSRAGLRLLKASAQTPRAQTKGLSGWYKQQRLSIEQLQIAQFAGVSVTPSFITKNESLSVSSRDILRRRTGKVAIIGYDHPLYEALFTGDAGAYMTPFGEGTLASRRNLGSIKLNNIDRKTLWALKHFGLDPRGPDSSSIVTRIDPGDIEMARGRIRDIYKYSSKGAASKRLALKRLIQAAGPQSGVFDAVAALGKEVTLSTSAMDGQIRLNFNTAHLQRASLSEMLVGMNRMTAPALSESSPLYSLAQQLGSQGVEVLVGEGHVGKGGVDRFDAESRINNFIEVMKEEGKLSQALAILKVKGHKTVNLKGLNKTYSIPVVEDLQSAQEGMYRYLRKLKSSRNEAKRRLARDIEFGKDVTADIHGIPSLVKSVHIVHADLSIRSDVGMDMNMTTRYRMTPGKMKTLAMSSKLMGFNDPMDDPMFRIYSGRNLPGKFTSSLDFNFDPSSNFYQYAKALSDESYVPKSNIVTRSGTNLSIDGQRLKNLPGLNKFSVGAGGVKYSDLSDTLLDKKFRDKLLFLDLGKGNEIDIMKGGMLIGKRRYVPVPMFVSRISSKDARVIMNGDHPFIEYMRAFQNMAGPEFAKNIQKATYKTVQNMLGKEGTIAKTLTHHIAESFAARVSPQSGNYFSSIEDMVNPDRIFDAYVSRKAMSAEILKKKGFSKKSIERITKLINSRDFTYITLAADPAQRGEHLGNVFRLRFTDEAYSGGPLNLHINSLAERLFERDRDRDPIRGIFLEAMMGDSPENQQLLKERIAKQAAQIQPIISFIKDEMSALGGKGSKAAQNIISSYLGQKTWASYGYSIARPVERVLPLIAQEGIEGLSRFGIKTVGKLDPEHIAYIQKIFKDSPERLGAAFALNQTLFQAGVDKGLGKGSLQELGKFLVSLSDESRTAGSVDIASVIERSTPVFEEFLLAQKRGRVFQAAQSVIGSRSLLEAGLTEGAIEATSHEAVVSKVARLMAATLGVSAAIAPMIGSVRNTMSLMEDTYMPSDASGMSKLLNAILKTGKIIKRPKDGTAEAVSIDSSAAEKEILEEAQQSPTARKTASALAGETLKNLKSGFFSTAKKIYNSKWFTPAAVGIAGLAAYGYASRPNMSQEIARNVDSSQPTDTGPYVPDYSSLPVINTANPIARASRSRRNTSYNNMSSNHFNGRSDSRIVFEDKISPMNPWLLKQQMNRVAESDFAY